jgi:hypothetical protein
MQDVYDDENFIQQNLANANGIGNGALGRQNSNLKTGGAWRLRLSIKCRVDTARDAEALRHW